MTRSFISNTFSPISQYNALSYKESVPKEDLKYNAIFEIFNGVIVKDRGGTTVWNGRFEVARHDGKF